MTELKYKSESGIACYSTDRISNLKLSPENPENLFSKNNSNNKFKIINEKLHNKICKQKNFNNQQITYTISPDNIKLNIGNYKTFEFENNKDNVISLSTLIDNNDFIYLDIINYFNFTKKISELLNKEENQTTKIKGFLLEKEWVDNWKEHSFYNKIKNEYLENDNKNEIIKIIKEEQGKSNLNYDELYENENVFVKNMEQFKSLKNTKKQFEILNKEFLLAFTKNIEINIKPFDFFVSYKNYRNKT